MGTTDFFILALISILSGLVLSFGGLVLDYSLGLCYCWIGIVLQYPVDWYSADSSGKIHYHGEPLMNAELRSLTELDRLIHEPARLLIVTFLAAIERAEFLFLQYETQ